MPIAPARSKTEMERDMSKSDVFLLPLAIQTSILNRFGGGIDYGWNSFENAFKNRTFFNARRK
jgi:hypothetical protein